MTGLRRQIDVLFAQIDRGDAGPGVGPIDRARSIQKRNEQVEPAARNFIKPAQPLNQHYGRLRNYADRFRRDHQQHDRQKAKKEKGKKGGKGLHNQLLGNCRLRLA